jgi:para-nitrobenzyl esterase
MRKLLTLLFLLPLSSTLPAQVPLQVMTTDGLVAGAGTDNAAVQVWRGLPYAAPPVGANRWREPQPVAAWSGVRDATRFAPRCVQRGFAPGAEQAVASEDCLYLNVWSAAASTDALLPVLVWIHGGGFFGGSGSDAIYDAENLASKGAVVVTFNYRLGSFGFLAHPELTAESPNKSSGNYAMLDMIAVLEWVYDNIAAFGGDPINITIVGESAGAQAVGTLMASPLSAGLFHHAILQSGGWMGLSMGKQPTLAEREALGSAQVAAFGAASIEDLRQASAQQIFENFPQNGGINVDGYLLPQDTSLVFAAGKQHPVDVLAGSNYNEAAFFGPGLQEVQAFRSYADDKFGPLAAQFLQLYSAGSDSEANQSYLQAYSNELAWQQRQLGKYQSVRGLGAWIYFFTHVPPGQEARGATHVSELAYMFNQHEQNANWTAADRTLGETMSAYWVNFAARGNPNGAGLPVWPAFRANSTGSVLVLGDTVAAESTQIPAAQALEFFDAAYQRHVDALNP